MSSGYVREKVKEWLDALPVPFYDTNSIDQNPTDPLWCTVDWEAAQRERIDYCGQKHESGSFSVVFLAPAGTGDAATIAAGESAMEQFMVNVDPKLSLLIYDPPEDELRTGHDAPLYGASFRVEYEMFGG